MRVDRTKAICYTATLIRPLLILQTNYQSIQGFNGCKVHYETDSVQANLFCSKKQANKGYVDEQPARGISGPYAVERPNAIANTETVEIVVRNRSQPAVILSRTRPRRYSDYDFEPFSGRILFREPVPSVDENNNPVYIRISYEVEEEFGDKHWVGGLDAKLRFLTTYLLAQLMLKTMISRRHTKLLVRILIETG
ncbi:MAG: hypothetical protein IPN04_11720 [Rhodoferax sp.]|nr:hypothetical protein [Rhodoferax sp.]